MCDELLAAIKAIPALMATDAGRYSIDPEGMHQDKEKHILLFDLIYCCTTYHLFDGIPYIVPKTSERHVMQERKDKARQLAANLDEAKKQLAMLEKAKAYLNTVFAPGAVIRHTTFGEGTIIEVNGTNMTVAFREAGQKTLGILACFVNGLVTVKDSAAQEHLLEYKDILRRDRQIRSGVSIAEKDLLPYTEYLG